MSDKFTYQLTISRENGDALKEFARSRRRDGDPRFSDCKIYPGPILALLIPEFMNAKVAAGTIQMSPPTQDREELPGGAFAWRAFGYVGLFFPRGDRRVLSLLAGSVKVPTANGTILLRPVVGGNGQERFLEEVRTRLSVTVPVAST